MMVYYENTRCSIPSAGGPEVHSAACHEGGSGRDETGRGGPRVWNLAGGDWQVDGGVSKGRLEGAAIPPPRKTKGWRSPQGVAGGADRPYYYGPHSRPAQAPLCPVDTRSCGGSGGEAIRGKGFPDDDRSVVEAVGIHAAETGAPGVGTKPQGGATLAEGALSPNSARGPTGSERFLQMFLSYAVKRYIITLFADALSTASNEKQRR